MRVKVERSRPGPCALHGDILAMVAHQLADARSAVDLRDDLEQEIRRGEFSRLSRGVEGAMLVAHVAGRIRNLAVVVVADQLVDLDGALRLRQLLGNAS